MNILVTGGAGFIGSHACKALAARGHVPVVYDNLCYGHREAVQWGPFEAGDIADRVRLREVLRRYQPAALMHFAAFTSVGESVADPLAYYRNNIAGTATLLEAVIEHAVIPVVFSSTAAVYGIPDRTPIDEDHPLRPINPYGFTKLVSERLLTDLSVSHGLRSVRLRYFNAAGSDPDAQIGEDHTPETHLIPLVLRAILSGEPIRVFGTDYATPDGTCVRDYVHVMDIADAHVLALEHLLRGGSGGAFNLANASGFSVREVIAAAERSCGRPVPVIFAARRPGDPAELVGSARRAAETLGWHPRRSAIEVQIADAWRWFKDRPRGFS